MGYSTKILLDSISHNNHRLTTFEITFPRFVLAEFNTHRLFSRNSASSRAIPVEKQLKRVMDDPFIPFYWGKNQKGMQAYEELSENEIQNSINEWLTARDKAVDQAKKLLEIGVHKQITNRLLEPFMWHTVIVTATEWSNFFNLRDNPDAQPEIKKIAHDMKEAYYDSVPSLIDYDNWHRPLLFEEDNLNSSNDLNKISIARCARVSYLTHDGKRDHNEDIKLYNRLVEPGHMSPLEHVARPMNEEELNKFCNKKFIWNDSENNWIHNGEYTYFLGNFNGWVQYRKQINGEWDILSFK